MNMFDDTIRTVTKALKKGPARRFFTIVVFVAVAGSMTACDQFSLDEAQPTTSVSLDQAVNTVAGFNGLLNSGYDRLQGGLLYGQEYTLYPEALSDNADLVQGATTNRYPGPVQNQPRAHMGGYGALYSTINEMNVILENLDGFTPQAENPQAVKDRIRGEAQFLRALSYFDLVRIYSYMPGSIGGQDREPGDFTSGVPLRLEPTLSANDAQPIPRNENTAIYDRVVSDFQDADSLLAGNDEAASGPNRATAAAASGMLSRVHLYLTNWSQAESAATRAISLTDAEVVDSRSQAFEDAWFEPSYPGSVFELTMTSGQDATGATGLQDITFFTGNNFAYELLPSQDARSIFDVGDARTSLFATDPDGNVYIEKYNGSIASFTDRIPLLRVAEFYLNRAEARAQQGGNETGAQSDLNHVRERRGLSAITPSGQALLDEILLERRREFLFEGKRFFTLKRYARDIPKPQLGSGESIDFDGPLAERRLILAPLPENEVQSNPELEQNPGY